MVPVVSVSVPHYKNRFFEKPVFYARKSRFLVKKVSFKAQNRKISAKNRFFETPKNRKIAASRRFCSKKPVGGMGGGWLDMPKKAPKNAGEYGCEACERQFTSQKGRNLHMRKCQGHKIPDLSLSQEIVDVSLNSSILTTPPGNMVRCIPV